MEVIAAGDVDDDATAALVDALSLCHPEPLPYSHQAKTL
jgi:hypothetical protein